MLINYLAGFKDFITSSLLIQFLFYSFGPHSPGKKISSLSSGILSCIPFLSQVRSLFGSHSFAREGGRLRALGGKGSPHYRVGMQARRPFLSRLLLPSLNPAN